MHAYSYSTILMTKNLSFYGQGFGLLGQVSDG